jgi:hypothetical protein
VSDQEERERALREAEQERGREIEKALRDAAEERRRLFEAEERARKARDDDDPFKTEQRNR